MAYIRTTAAISLGALLGSCGARERSGTDSELISEWPSDDVESSEDFEVPSPARLGEVIVAGRPPPPISGGTLAVAADGTVAVAADPDRDAVYVIDLGATNARSLALPPGSEPGRVVFDGAGRAHVVMRGVGQLAAIELASGELVRQTGVCQLPRGLAYDSAEDALWVACASGELVSLAATDHTERSRNFVALDLRDVVVTPTGERFVSRYRSAELLRIDADGSIAARSKPPSLPSVRIGPGGPLFDEPAEERTSEEVFARKEPFQRRDVTMSPTLAWRTVLGSDANPLMLHQQSQDDEVVITQGGYGAGCPTISQTGITRFGPSGEGEQGFLVGGAGLAVDVAASPDGQWLALAKPGAYLQGLQGSVEVVSKSARPAPDLFPTLVRDAGSAAPDAGTAVAGDPEQEVSEDAPSSAGCVTGSSDGMDIQATAVAFDSEGALYVFSREPARLDVFHIVASRRGEPWPAISRAWSLLLSDVSMRDTGHELFHADVGSGLACASCHGEALDDGHVWTFRDVGPRRTQNMRGGLLSTLPLHWEGDMTTFQTLVDEVMTRRMGGFLVESRYGDALANWLDRQPALRLERTPSAAIERGKALFESDEVGCATCHAGETLTNDQTMDVGTGVALQVPSLRGLALRAPFMHDGCAATLAERFEPSCGGDRHGDTSQLTAEQLGDLIAYLETL